MKNYKNILAKFFSKRILVIGDLILDQYIHGSVSRISPEAPVPIVLQKGEGAYTPGGAANVANNLRSLGAHVTLIGRIGRDKEGQILLKELKKIKIEGRAVVVDPQIPTSLKTRVVVQHQQVLRLDREKAENFSPALLEKKVLPFIRRNIKNFDGIIISDYGKGMISAALVSEVCSLAIKNKKIITVDPKVEHFNYYAGVTAITPNRKEAENAIRNIKITQNVGRKFGINSDRLETQEQVNQAGEALLKFLGLESLLITLGEEGMRLFERGKKPVHIETRAREVFDVTGAGDTVISVFTLSLTSGATKHEAADLANYAAGIVVGKMGAVAVTKHDLLSAVQ